MSSIFHHFYKHLAYFDQFSKTYFLQEFFCTANQITQHKTNLVKNMHCFAKNRKNIMNLCYIPRQKNVKTNQIKIILIMIVVSEKRKGMEGRSAEKRKRYGRPGTSERQGAG